MNYIIDTHMKRKKAQKIKKNKKKFIMKMNQKNQIFLAKIIHHRLIFVSFIFVLTDMCHSINDHLQIDNAPTCNHTLCMDAHHIIFEYISWKKCIFFSPLPSKVQFFALNLLNYYMRMHLVLRIKLHCECFCFRFVYFYFFCFIIDEMIQFNRF